MNINDFFEFSKGNWLCQKTFYDIQNKKHGSIILNLFIEQQAITDDMLKIIEKNNIKIAHRCFSFRFNWESIKTNSHLIVANPNSLCEGEVYQINNSGNIIKSQFHIDIIENKLTFKSKINGLFLEEVIFFQNPNLKISIGIIKNKNTRLLAFFTSGIRMQPLMLE
uniref:Chromophore lyase CpcS/CpeS homolog n=1 Tax=Boldia erythrosiphon TaxID=74908 RepID=A0A1X9PTH1_9RHOD|nr:chromophore lyase cpcS/cpeS [Boldia erythrosiphon]ARO90529.1 chromophore lyase cpcS/cpeS [Boldia erythrosiphon]